MNRGDIQSILERKFREQFPEEDECEIDSLARNLTQAIICDKTLKELHATTFEKIIDAQPHSLDFVSIMKKIRANKPNMADKTPKPSKREQCVLNWGMFLKCWYPFLKNQNITDVEGFPLMFTAKWIEKEKKFIDDDELAWCEEIARKHTAAMQDTIKASYEFNYIRNEAIVFIVLRKFLVKMWTEPEKTRTFLNKHRKEYTDMYVRIYGNEPDLDKCSSQSRAKISPIATIEPLNPKDYERELQ